MHSIETKQKMSNAHKNPSNEIGKKHSIETRQKISNSRIGKPGKSPSEETRKKISDANKNQPIIECPHCGKTSSDSGAMNRWHFDNCKLK